MPYLIDTNIAIHAVEGKESVLDKFVEHDGEVLLSALSLAELQRGVYKHEAHTALRLARLDVLLRDLPVLAFDAEAAKAYGRIIACCGWVKGRDYDRMIAAHAMASRAVLVTNNIADFCDIPGLCREDWTIG